MQILRAVVFSLLVSPGVSGQDYRSIPTEEKAGDRLLAEYFELETRQIEASCLAEIRTADDWHQARPVYREQLFEMLGIPSQQPRPPLDAEVTGSQQHGGVVIENLVFQSLPGLYVTANFYRPATPPEQPLPAILYVCGHAGQKEGGISFGNKTAYHRHGMWFANHGYVCLSIDTVQLGEIEGIHHGTYREGRWWWNARGYTPAGVEAWNGMRALDYLESRPEVDAQRLGMTGRSGGGAYSWWVSALDERVKVTVPVAGITSLRNHVVDGVVEGHCDCMYHLNSYRWDFPAIAALLAPRPLLIANTDKDTIFPLGGVVDVYHKARRIYQLLGAGDKIGLAIAEGPHKDTQPLRTEAFHWFERYLKGRAPTDEIDTMAPVCLEPATMRALAEIPDDEIVTRIDETFVAQASEPDLPADRAAWLELRDRWMSALREKSFRGWPQPAGELELTERSSEKIDGVSLIHYEFVSQTPFRLPLVIASDGNPGKDEIRLRVVDDAQWQAMAANKFERLRQEAMAGSKVLALFPPRGSGPTAWTDDVRERIQIRRRHMLLGQTLDSMRVWDIRRAISALKTIEAFEDLPLQIEADGVMAGNVLYASLFEDGIAGLELISLPSSHASGGPIYLNVLRSLNTPAAAAMAAERLPLKLRAVTPGDWSYAAAVAERLGWGARIGFAEQ